MNERFNHLSHMQRDQSLYISHIQRRFIFQQQVNKINTTPPSSIVKWSITTLVHEAQRCTVLKRKFQTCDVDRYHMFKSYMQGVLDDWVKVANSHEIPDSCIPTLIKITAG
jgi:hypothetical protein